MFKQIAIIANAQNIPYRQVLCVQEYLEHPLLTNAVCTGIFRTYPTDKRFVYRNCQNNLYLHMHVTVITPAHYYSTDTIKNEQYTRVVTMAVMLIIMMIMMVLMMRAIMIMMVVMMMVVVVVMMVV